MSKSLALILVATLAVLGTDFALAQAVTPAPVVAPVVASSEAEALAPVAGASSELAHATEARTVPAKDLARTESGRAQTPRRVRKEYPNVMGMSLTTWMVSRSL